MGLNQQKAIQHVTQKKIKMHMSGPTQFKPVLLKGQLSFYMYVPKYFINYVDIELCFIVAFTILFDNFTFIWKYALIISSLLS